MKINKQTKLALVGALALSVVLATPALAKPSAPVVDPALTPTTPYDLTTHTEVPVDGFYGGTAIFANYWNRPAGTGVFNPFLTIERDSSGGNPSNLEQGYNTDHVLYNDQQRPNWNTLLTLGDLAQVSRSGIMYYAFVLDANEPGAGKSLISVDNIRIYTSSADHTGDVQNNIGNLNALGDLRWAMNDPAVNGTKWVKLDSNQQNVDSPSNGGSGVSDMILYVPVSAFTGVSLDSFLWFYNLNGLEYTADSDLGAEAGYEEWQAFTGPSSVPDGGTTLAMVGFAITGLGLLRRKLS